MNSRQHARRSAGRDRIQPRAILILAAMVAGCSSEESPTVYPVEGAVFYQGKPAASAQVFLHPIAPAGAPAARPQGVVEPDGTFRLSTFRAYDGAPPGSYRLSVIWLSDRVQEDGENAGPDRLKGRYRDASRNPWTVTVGPGTNRIEPLELR